MDKAIRTLLKSCIPLAVAVAGVFYLKSLPSIPTYNPSRLETSAYSLTDADRDSRVDVIAVNSSNTNLPPCLIYLAKDTEDYLTRNNFNQYGFSRLMPSARDMPLDLRIAASKRLTNGAVSEFDNMLIDYVRKENIK